MTVSTTTSRVEYAGNGATTAFSVPFYFLANADLKVYQAGTLKTLTTHYTVSGAGTPAGGTVTFLSAPANGEDVVIFRDPALTQTTDYAPNDPFPAESHERALDRLTMIAQRLSNRVDRAAVLSDSDTSGASVTLPTPSAGKALVWNAGATALENSTYDPDEQVANATAQAVAAAASAAAASTSETNAAGSAAAAAASYDSFDDRYLGAKAADPTLDNDGNALIAGALYWNTSSSVMRVYSGSAWGNVVNSTSFAVQTFSGTGAQTAFTLSNSPGTVNALMVYIAGVRQTPTTDYTLSGTTLTFAVAPLAGSNNILTIGVSAQDIGTPSDGTVTTAKLAAGVVNGLTTVTMDTAADSVAIADGSDSGNVKKALLPAATDTARGIVELATTAEAAAGTDTVRAITPASLFAGLNASGSAPIYAARAWVNFNGTGTVAIRASGNVSSITDLGTGYYRVNYSTAMPDANYAINSTAGGGTADTQFAWAALAAAPAAGSCEVFFSNMGGGGATYTSIDCAYCTVSINR